MTENDIRKACLRFMDRHKGLSQFDIVLMESRKYPAPQYLPDDQVAGYIRGHNTVFILTDRIKKPVEVEQTLRHEIYGHAILDSLPSTKKHKVLDDVHYAICKDAEFRKKYDEFVVNEYGRKITKETLEEYFARVAEGRIKVSWSESIVASVRGIVRSAMSSIGLNLPFNDLDVRNFLTKEIRRIQTGEHQLNSQNAEALQRNKPFMARLEDFEDRLTKWKRSKGLETERPNAEIKRSNSIDPV